jgi:uncharacterized protein (TIGR02145 family)
MRKLTRYVIVASGCCLLLGSCVKEGSITDIDGNVYRTVIIGKQEWMAENLKTSRYRTDIPIPHVTDTDELVNATTGAWVNYNNEEANDETYGKLYNWYAVDSSEGICPEGWHVPSDKEWTQLINYLGGKDNAGCKMKEAGTDHWESPNTCANNRSGFTGLPGGYHDPTGFVNLGRYGAWWSSAENQDEGLFYSLNYNNSSVYQLSQTKSNAISVRCVRD